MAKGQKKQKKKTYLKASGKLLTNPGTFRIDCIDQRNYRWLV